MGVGINTGRDPDQDVLGLARLTRELVPGCGPGVLPVDRTTTTAGDNKAKRNAAADRARDKLGLPARPIEVRGVRSGTPVLSEKEGSINSTQAWT